MIKTEASSEDAGESISGDRSSPALANPIGAHQEFQSWDSKEFRNIVDLYFVFFLVECSPNTKVTNSVFYCYSEARSQGQFTSHHSQTNLQQIFPPLQ